MLTEEEFEQWCSQLQLPQAIRQLIAQIRPRTTITESTRELWQRLWKIL